MTERHGTLIAADAYTEYHDIADGEEGKVIDRRVLFRMLGGKRMSARDVLTIQRRRAELIPLAVTRLDGAILAMPTTPITAPAIAPLEADDEVFYKTNTRTLRNVSLGNVLEMCGVALPNGRDDDGMPTSFLISAPWGEDERLLSAALAIEKICVSRSNRWFETRNHVREIATSGKRVSSRREERVVMARVVNVAAAQMAPISKTESRAGHNRPLACDDA